MNLKIKTKFIISTALAFAILLALLFYFIHEKEGEQKDLEYRYSLLENWRTDSTSGSDSYVVNLFVDAANVHNVVITNFSNMGISVKASLTNSELKIESQKLNIKDEIIYVEGTGLVRSNTLNIEYTLIKNTNVFKAKCEGTLHLNSTK